MSPCLVVFLFYFYFSCSHGLTDDLHTLKVNLHRPYETRHEHDVASILLMAV